jgi:hypothetical protein
MLSSSDYFLASGFAGTLSTSKLECTSDPLTSRWFDVHSHESNLGDKNPHVIHRIPGAGGVSFLLLWGKADISYGGCTGLLSGSCTRPLWSQSGRSSVHGI